MKNLTIYSDVIEHNYNNSERLIELFKEELKKIGVKADDCAICVDVRDLNMHVNYSLNDFEEELSNKIYDIFADLFHEHTKED